LSLSRESIKSHHDSLQTRTVVFCDIRIGPALAKNYTVVGLIAARLAQIRERNGSVEAPSDQNQGMAGNNHVGSAFTSPFIVRKRTSRYLR